jgi:hypothetical protein
LSTHNRSTRRDPRERKSLRSLRKTTAAVAALLAAAIALAAVAGCVNSSEAKAREYIAAAREKGKAVTRNQDDLKKHIAEFTRLTQSTQDAAPDANAAMRKSLADLVGSVQATNKAAQETRSEYEKVLALNDAAKYKEYARLQIEILNLIDQGAGLLNSFAAIIGSAMDAALAGQDVSSEALQNETKPIVDQQAKINSQIEKLNKQAADLADELKL